MKYSKISAILLPVLFLGLTAPVFADTATGASLNTTVKTATGTKLLATETKLRDKSTADIQKRIEDLTALSARISTMTHLSASTKTSLTALIQSNITELTALQAKIAAETIGTNLKADVASIATSFRIYRLIEPEIHILAAADRAGTIGDMMTAMNAKFDSRIAAATAAGKDTSAITSARADMTAKIADSKIQINAAIAGVSALSPDNGDKTILASNTAALQKARADLRVASSDLTAANKDIKSIVAALKGFKLDVSASSNTTVKPDAQ